MPNYKSDLVMGEKYRDATTGLEGTLVSVHFYEHACERATLRWVNGNREVVEASFDAPELIRIETGRAARTSRPGGPRRSEGGRNQ